MTEVHVHSKTEMNIVTVRYCDVPVHLQAGDFFRNLNGDDREGTIDIPADRFAADNHVIYSHSDLTLMVRVYLYWALDEIPVQILEVCAQHDFEEWRNVISSVPEACESGLLAQLISAYQHPRDLSLAHMMRTARWEIIRHALSRSQKDSGVTAVAARLGNLEMLKYLHEQGFVWHAETCQEATKNGHLHCVQYARENGCPWDAEVQKIAAYNGHLHIMQYAHQQGLEWHVDVCTEAVVRGHLECLQYAHENGCPWDVDAVSTRAASYCQRACLQYLLDNHHDGSFYPRVGALCVLCCITGRAMGMSRDLGQLDCLRLLCDYGATLDDENACYHAVTYARLDCLEYLHEQGCPWSERLPHTAARSGNLAILRYLMEHGCPYDSKLMQEAAWSGSIECLQYLVEGQGMHMDATVSRVALLRGKLQCLHYLIDQGEFLDSSSYFFSGSG